MSSLVRSESHSIAASSQTREDIARTIAAYRVAVHALATVIQTHWVELNQAKNKCAAIEALFHPTSKRPMAKYALLSRKLGKMPSYLRRAAIEAAFGAVSSFLSNYSNWLDDTERPRGNKPPRMGFSSCNPPLYGGNMIVWVPGKRAAQIKLLQADGTWAFTAALVIRGRVMRSVLKKELCPTLMLKGTRASLSCPSELTRKSFIKNADIHRVCSVDVGINTAMVAAIVDHTGTVIARKFFACGRHNDQRDKLNTQIAAKQKAAGSSVKGLCNTLYNRIAGLSQDAARQLVRELMDFAQEHGAQAVVVENLKGWKPKGRGQQKKRFHRFQHRALIQGITLKCEEFGIRFVEVFARGTSYFAYDGSGPVKRSKENAALATFGNGRQYNADLNAAYNIAARGLIRLLNLGVETPEQTGQSSGRSSRIPTVLADVWAAVRAKVALDTQMTPSCCESGSDAPTTALCA